MTSERPKGSSHAERVIRVMQAFAELPGDTHSLKVISEHTELDPAVVHRILAAQVAAKWVERVGRGKYRLGSHAARAGMQAMAGMYDGLDQHEILVDLQADCGGLVLFYSLASVGARRVCTDYAIGNYCPDDFGMTAYDIFTAGCSLRTGASGRALLAYVPESLREIALAEPIPGTAGPGALSNDDLLATLDGIRTRGYAIGRQECLPGWDSVAAPALWGETALGVVLLLKPLSDTPNDITDYIDQVLGAAQLISLAATQGGRNPQLVA
ncbi:helix-turn-helix domain-containing protein [Streptomyces sp. NPDC056362]|uniref:helix-turn-helix domain-containing protein n=1 Tax=unclassified Streptomyces TaxID=2593676 RepID=UPI0035E3747D